MAKKKLLRVVVNRARHLTGDIAEATNCDSALYSTRNPVYGMMCCLGFACRALGATVAQIKDKSFPSDAAEDTQKPALWNALLAQGLIQKTQSVWDKEPYFTDPEVIRKLADTNDNYKLTPTEREKQIKALGREAGINFVFTGKRPDVTKLGEEIYSD